MSPKKPDAERRRLDEDGKRTHSWKVTHPVKGLEKFRELLGHLTSGNGVIKAYCEVAAL